MQLRLTELTGWEALAGGYAVYADCMYLPTKEKYQQKMQAYLQDAAIKIYGCFCETEMKGLLVLRSFPQKQAELVGIAVEKSARGQGIGTLMLRQVMESCCLQAVFAETDEDAVEFYRKSGFTVETHIETYDGKPVVRYTCRLERYN